MAGINGGKVVVGGLVAGIVYNAFDFVTNTFVTAADMEANMTRLGLDPALMQSGSAIATWVSIDFLMGLLVVWVYASMRPRFGPGPKTAVFAGLVPYLAVSFVLFGLTQGGMLTQGLFWKMSALQVVGTTLGAVAGAAVYKEGGA